MPLMVLGTVRWAFRLAMAQLMALLVPASIVVMSGDEALPLRQLPFLGSGQFSVLSKLPAASPSRQMLLTVGPLAIQLLLPQTPRG
jgi:hypothetical protein